MSGPVAGRVLVTGAAGQIGRVLCPGLAGLGWWVRGLDSAGGPGAAASVHAVPGTAETVRADVRDAAALVPALRGIDAVVHLAGIATEAPLADILSVNVDGTATVFDAARRSGARRIVFASSNHAVGYAPREAAAPAPADLPPRPDTYYGVGKVFGEALGRLFVDRYGLDVVCLRIGSFADRPFIPRHLATWLSPDDAVRLVHAALTAPAPGFALLWGVSANTRGWWDLAAGRALGYSPTDDAEAYAAEVLGAPGAPDPADPELGRIGGEYTGARFDAP